MKNILILVFFVPFFLSAQTSGNYDRKHFSAFPDLSKVIEHYSKMDTLFLRESAALYEWEKRYDGWYILKRNPSKPSQALYYQMIWSAKKRDWMHQPSGTTLSPELQRALQQRIGLNNQARSYGVCPVFGYEGYEKEILLWWRGKENELNETECECLMQVYGNLVYRHWLFDEGKYGRWSKFDSTYVVADVRTAAIDSVKSLAQRWHKASERLLTLQPEHWTGSSSTRSKAQNDKMTIVSDFLIWRKPELAEPFLKQVQYDTFALQTAENTLKSCPENAILFTQGEYSYYPLLYVQQRLKVRTDVDLVYLPFLNLGRYTQYLQQEKGIAFSVPQAHYQFQNGKIWRVQWDTVARQWSDFVAKLPAQAFASPADYILPSPRWWLGKEQNARFQWRQQICIQENIAFLDIISNQFGKQPICFSMDLQSQLEQWAMKPNLRLRGIVLELVKEQETGLPNGQFPVDKKALESNLRQAFALQVPSSAHWRYSEYQQYAHWYISAAYHLALQYSLESDTKPLSEYLKWMYNHFPPDKYWYGSGHLIFAFLLSDQKKSDEFLQHIRCYAKEIDQKIRWLEYLSPEERVIRRHQLRQEVQMLLRTADELDLMDIVQQYEAQFRVLFYE